MSQSTQPSINVLFVCTGNICRSPMAEAVFAHLVAEAGLGERFEIASAALGDWHAGESPHRGTLDTLRRHAIPLGGKRAQVIRPAMLARANYIIAMDESHLQELEPLSISTGGTLARLLDFAPDAPARDVPDPYYTGKFEEAYQLILAGTRGLLQHIREKENLDLPAGYT